MGHKVYTTTYNTGDLVKEVFSGTYEECVEFLREELNNENRLRYLRRKSLMMDIVNVETSRFVSWVL